jgi:pre-rRNA-processing protein IPI3
MAASTEILLTTESLGQLWNVCAWNPKTGAALKTFKGSSSTSRTLDLISDDFLLSADSIKPLINVWAIGRQDHAQTRIVCTGKVTALSVSRDGSYCVAGIAGKLYVWQTCTGNLLVVLSGHYLKVSCIRFTDDGSHFVSGSDDGLVLVWPISSVLSRGTNRASVSGGIEPCHVWSQHSSAITDIHVGLGGVGARVATASLDKSVKIWQLSSGQLIDTLVYDSPVTSVVMDHAESRLYAGASDGNIYLVNFVMKSGSILGSLTTSSSSDRSTPFVLRGHRSVVNCLSMSMNCETLASGSADGTVMLWNTYSRECVETIKHQGPVTNCLLIPMPVHLLEPDDHLVVPFTAFKRHVHGTQESHGERKGDGELEQLETIAVKLSATRKIDTVQCMKQKLATEDAQHAIASKRSKPASEGDVLVSLESELSRVRQVNKKMYQFAIDKILTKS